MHDAISQLGAKIDRISNPSAEQTQTQETQKNSGGQSQERGGGGDEDDVDVSPNSGSEPRTQTPPPYPNSTQQQTPPPYPNSTQQQTPPPYPNSTQQQTPPPYPNSTQQQTPPANGPDEAKEKQARENAMMDQLKQGLGADMQARIDQLYGNIAGMDDSRYWDMMREQYGVSGPGQQQAENIRANIENMAKYRASQFEGNEKDVKAFRQRMADVANAKQGDRQAMWNDPSAWHRSNQDYARSLGEYIGQNVQTEYNAADKTGAYAKFYYVDSNGNKQYLSGPGYMPAVNRDSTATALSHHWNNAAWDKIDNAVEGAKNALWQSSANAFRNAPGTFFNKLGAAIGAFGDTNTHPVGPTYSRPNNGVPPAYGNNASPRSNTQNAAANTSRQGQPAPPNYTDTVRQRIQEGAGSSLADRAINDFNAAMQARYDTVQGHINQAYHQHNAGVMDNYDATLNDVQKSAQAHTDALQGAYGQIRQSAQDNNNALQREANKTAARRNVNQMLAGNYR
jgi:hypothetical protein